MGEPLFSPEKGFPQRGAGAESLLGFGAKPQHSFEVAGVEKDGREGGEGGGFSSENAGA